METEQQVITKDKLFVASLDKRYQILPNESCEEKMNEIGKRLGLIPVHLADKDWFYVRPNRSSFTNANKYGAETKWCQVLVNPKPYRLVDGKDVKLGLVLKNSIDGAWSFSASTFTFRTICENMMLHIARQKFLSVGSETGDSDYMSMKADMTPDQLKDHQILQLSHGYRRHTVSLQIDQILPELQAVYEGGKKYLDRWNTLHNLKLTKELGRKIATSLPKWVIESDNKINNDPSVSDIIQIEKDKISVKDGFNQSQMFNALTNALTHDGKTFQTTMTNFAKVDRMFFSGLE